MKHLAGLPMLLVWAALLVLAVVGLVLWPVIQQVISSHP